MFEDPAGRPGLCIWGRRRPWCFRNRRPCSKRRGLPGRRHTRIARTPHAQAHRHRHHHDHRGGTDHHRTGLRVRLFGHPGLQGAARGRLPHRPRQFQPRHHHDRPGHGGPDLCRAHHARGRRQDHRGRAPCRPGRFRAAAHHGRPDGAQLRPGAREDGDAEGARRRADRRHRGRDRQGRGPRAVPRRHDQDRPRHAALPPRRLARRGPRLHRRRRPAGHHPAVLHDGRHGRRHRLQPRRIYRDHRARPRCLADHAGPRRGERARLEGIRDGGRARPRRQRHHRLLDRERRSRWASTRAIPSRWRRR